MTVIKGCQTTVIDGDNDDLIKNKRLFVNQYDQRNGIIVDGEHCVTCI